MRIILCGFLKWKRKIFYERTAPVKNLLKQRSSDSFVLNVSGRKFSGSGVFSDLKLYFTKAPVPDSETEIPPAEFF